MANPIPEARVQEKVAINEGQALEIDSKGTETEVQLWAILDTVDWRET